METRDTHHGKHEIKRRKRLKWLKWGGWAHRRYCRRSYRGRKLYDYPTEGFLVSDESEIKETNSDTDEDSVT